MTITELIEKAEAALRKDDDEEARQHLLAVGAIIESKSEDVDDEMAKKYIQICIYLFLVQKQYDSAIRILKHFEIDSPQARTHLAMMLFEWRDFQGCYELLADLVKTIDDLDDDERVLSLVTFIASLVAMDRLDDALRYLNNIEYFPQLQKLPDMRKQLIELRESISSTLTKQGEELEQSRRLAYLGLMATGVAHQINQPVGIIRAAVDGALVDMDEGLFKPEEMRPLLEKIKAQTDRINVITGRFRERARADRTTREQVDLNQLIHETITNVFDEQFQQRSINLMLDLAPDEPRVWANPFELEEVLVILLNNARDALQGQQDGKITIKTWRKDDGWTGFSVEDNGRGLSDEIKANLFVPFTSTKSSSTNTGIGLHLAREFINELHGKIYVDENYTDGARFVVELPPVETQEGNEHGA